MINSYDIFYIALAFLMAVAAGLAGSFALMRRLTLASDAISHIALPGLGLAMLFNANPILGGAATLLIGALLIWKIGQISDVNTDAIIGVIFAISLAIGGLITPEAELIETLFGSTAKIEAFEFMIGTAAALLAIAFIIVKRRTLVLAITSKDLALTAGVDVKKLDLYFMLIFALTIILGLRYLGVLLMGSLIIIPAAVARNLAQNLNSMLWLSTISAVISIAGGLIFSQIFGFALGPTTISVAGFIFFATLFIKKAATR